MKERISIGDVVIVNFFSAQTTLARRATVLSMPQATGDSWILKEDDGQIHYVSEGCTITKLEDGPGFAP